MQTLLIVENNKCWLIVNRLHVTSISYRSCKAVTVTNLKKGYTICIVTGKNELELQAKRSIKKLYCCNINKCNKDWYLLSFLVKRCGWKFCCDWTFSSWQVNCSKKSQRDWMLGNGIFEHHRSHDKLLRFYCEKY